MICPDCGGYHEGPQHPREGGPKVDYAKMHHRVRFELDSSGAQVLGMTHCGLLLYYRMTVCEWDDVTCNECHLQRTVPAA